MMPNQLIVRMISAFLFITVLYLTACDYSRIPKDTDLKDNTLSLSDSENKSPYIPPASQTYRLWHTIDQFDLNAFDFFGGFFEDRLKFFYARNPGLSFGNTDVNLIILYFLDERLVKIRYHLNHDITDHILDSLGLGALKTRYNIRKEIMATEKSIKKLKDYNKKTGNQDAYEIFWDRYIIESSYQVDPRPSNLYTFDSISAHYVYIDQLKSYSKNLIKLENELGNKLTSSVE